MRKILLSLCLAISMNFFVANAQTMVVTTPQHKNVVLEEYTGIHCGYCPDGHAKAEALSDANPGRVVLVNIHAGNYAVPGTGEPDYRTDYGDALASAMGVTGYPSGTVNRTIFPEIGSIPAMSRSAWAYAANQEFVHQSPVNVAFTSLFDTATRELSVAVELYYTQSSGAAQNYLQVVLLENHVYGPQSGASSLPYEHKHMLRYQLTGQWGQEISSTSQGAVFADTITYTVPVDFEINNCDVAVYVSEDHFNIYTGVQAPAVGGSHDGTTEIYTGTLSLLSDDVAAGTVGTTTQFTSSMESSLAGDEDFTITLSSFNAPVDWSAVFSVDSVDYTGQTTVTLSNYVAKDIVVKVTPGNTAALAVYELEVSSNTYPSTPVRTQSFYVVRGITDLVANGTGSWGDGGVYSLFEHDYLNGLVQAGNTSYALADGAFVAKANDAAALSGITNIYMNIGWRFPSFSDETANALMDFMDNGGNVFIAGQDIAWDIASGDGYGTPATQTLFTNYMHVSFVDDGGAANSEFTPVSSDPVFGNLASSSLVDVYNGFFYPDQVTPINGGEPIFNYNANASKVGGVRFENSSYKMVYLCVDLAMVADTAVRYSIIETAHDYFYGTVSVDEPTLAGTMSFFPNPTDGKVTIEIDQELAAECSVELIEVSGRKVLEMNLGTADKLVETLDFSELPAGLYFLRLNSGDQSKTEKIEILK